MLMQIVQNSLSEANHILLGWQSRLADPYFKRLEDHIFRHLMAKGLNGSPVSPDDVPVTTVLRATRISLHNPYPRFYLIIFQAPSTVYAVSADRLATTPPGRFYHEPKVYSRAIPKDQSPSKELIDGLKEEAYRM